MIKKIPLLVIVMAIISCSSPTTKSPEINREEVRIEERRQQEMVKKEKLHASNKKASDNKRLQRVAQNISRGGEELCRYLGKQIDDCDYEFKLDSKSKVLNAYADGHKIVVTSEMIEFAKSDDELAAIIGHEYAHNLMGHMGAQTGNMLVGKLLGAAVDVLASSQGVNTGSTFSRIGEQVGVITYSKSFEREADYVGLYIAAIAGYDINKAPDIWRKMSVANKDIGKDMNLTHPSNPERYISLAKIVEEINNKKRKHQPLIPKIKG